MKPSEYAKAAGLKSLAQLARITGESEQTLINWSRRRPTVYKLLVLGAATLETTSSVISNPLNDEDQDDA